MKFQLFFYFIGFLILIFVNQFTEDVKNDRALKSTINLTRSYSNAS